MKLFKLAAAALFSALLFTTPTYAAEINKFGIQNAVAVEEQIDAVTWTELPTKTDVPLKKSWTVNFSQTVSYDKIDGAVIEQGEKFIPVEIDFPGKKSITITPTEVYKAGTNYTLKVFLNNGKRYKMSFKTTSDLNTLIDPVKPSNNPYEAQIIRVPAMPEKGFNFPYYLRMPSEDAKRYYDNKTAKQYIMIDTPNNGVNGQEGTEFAIKRALKNKEYYSIHQAESTNSVMLMPAVPRTNVYYESKEHGYNWIDAHSFERDAAIMEELVNNKTIYEQYLKPGYADFDLTPEMYVNYDEQIIKMFEHAVDYLASQNVKVADKFIINGYSSGGTFADRISMLQPDKVKMVISGATLDDMVLPITEYKGETFVFPTGVADYKKITGRDFDLNKINKIAKLVFMGKDDEQTPLMYGDAYSEAERQAIIKVFGQDTLQRAKSMMNVYHEQGGKGMFILDVGIGHDYSQDMQEYIIDFIIANRNSDTPVYPIPKNPKQLEYQLKQ